MLLRKKRPVEHKPGVGQLESVSDASMPTHVRAARAGAWVVGAVAAGALAMGALAIGALAIGRLVIGRARIRRLEIDELVVGRLQVTDSVKMPSTPRTERDNAS